MTEFITKDNIELEERSDIDDLIEDSNEKFLWTGRIVKVNKNETHQERDFIVTNMNVINAGNKGNFLKNIFVNKVRRVINIQEISAITYSEISEYFILHIKSEYDYYLNTPLKDEMIEAILYSRKKLNMDNLPFYFTEEVDLFQFVCYENEENNKEMPNVTVQMINYDNFGVRKLKKIEEENFIGKNTDIVITPKVKEHVDQFSFDIIKKIGEGFFSKVYVAIKKDTKKKYALKILSKMDIINKKFIENIKTEKEILLKLKNPFIVTLEYCFVSPTQIFMAMPYIPGGELYYHLRKRIRFTEDYILFYASQILEGLVYLHSMNIVYRDLKPENIILDENGNILLADFGISKILEKGSKATSFVGTPEYVSPEIVLEQGHDKSVDVWSFGILLYEMAIGLPPFYSKNKREMLKWIVKANPKFPRSVVTSDSLKDLILSVY